MGCFQDMIEFYSVDSDLRHGTLVLECFSHEVVLVDGKSTDYCRLIFSIAFDIWNVLKAHKSQSNDGILGATDGIYRLHFGEIGGRTLVDFGTYAERSNSLRHVYIGYICCFFRTEQHVAYAAMFRTIRLITVPTLQVLTLKFDRAYDF
ncbi:hypothetical protein GN958_ATG07410 [Phytophthora infestans]|uniref:Uncharacterized protein n=1 Tax=Phytophthora infestans TaxID=4787 RepID=A0A8S9URJ7_PHYIN|nr:hypothetical protein GN958_ATG07410 [Phytophthora infestans]